MNNKYWQDHLSAGFISVAGTCYELLHLKPHNHHLTIASRVNAPAVEVTLSIEYSSHCVSSGPKHGETLDFDQIGIDHLIIDHRNVWRAFHARRYALSRQLPEIITTLERRQCLFTGHVNWLTLEGQEVGYPPGTFYEVFFNLRRESGNAIRVYVESAYVRDRNEKGARAMNYKHYERVKGWVLMLKRLRNETVRKPFRR